MKKFNTLLTYVSSNRIWLITLGCLDLFFAFLAWVAYPGDFLSLVGLMIFVSLAAFVIPFVISIHKRSKIDAAFRRFLLEPDDTNEYLLCESAPASMRPYIHELAHHLRMQEGYVNEQQLKVANYESYIENWVHEIKKPLSLMTLLLDNRKVEMSPLVHTRMLYVRDHVRQNVEQILYFSRLGAAHKDCYFEPILILETCREAVEDNLSLLEEAQFSVTYSGNDCNVISNKKGFMFILGQIISNSVKYAVKDTAPTIQFSVTDNPESGQITLSVSDNGTGIPASDLPFVFDKGFTGDAGSFLSRSTGMGLYLVQKMAKDLAIDLTDVYQMPYVEQTNHFVEFLYWLKAGKHTRDKNHRSPNNGTCNAYLRDVFRFYLFIEEEYQQFGELKVLSYNYFVAVDAVGVKKSIRSKSFKGYLKEEEHKARAAKKDEIVEILKACTNIRDRLLMLLLAETGYRIGEILGIDYSKDIDYQNHIIRVYFREDNENGARAKNAEYRSAKISKDTFGFLNLYIAEYRKLLQHQTSLFVNISGDNIGKPMNVEAVYSMLKRMDKKTGIKITPHMLRHYFGNERRKAGWSLELIQLAYGHRHIQTTINYLDIVDDELLDASQEFYEKHSSLYGIEELL